MSAPTREPVTREATAGPPSRRGRWLTDWDPEDRAAWDAGGRGVARRNLVASISCEFLGFCVWALWSVVVPQLPAAGFSLTVDQQFWLIALPALVGAALRIPYTFAVPLFGGRTWTVVSALLLLVPVAALTWVVGRPETPFPVLLAVAALAGLGGGNFASSMTNITFFFPEREKGRALGTNAAGGNLGTGIVQLAVPAIITIGAGVQLQRIGLVLVPLILVAAVLAWRLMDNLASVRADYRSFALAAAHRHTWIISFLYVGTFGSFIGYSGAFPTLLKTQFAGADPALAFLGALVGALSRPLGGMLADRLGGARVTIGSFGLLTLGAVGALVALDQQSFVLFFTSFMVLFLGTGLGNGATYRMIPAVFRATAVARGGDVAAARKAAAGCLGIAGAVGAFGGFVIPRGFAVSTTATGSIATAIVCFLVAYLVMAALTWVVYRRPGSALAGESI